MSCSRSIQSVPTAIALCIGLACTLLCTVTCAGEVPQGWAVNYEAADTLDCSPDSNPDAESCLSGLRWEPSNFSIKLEPSDSGRGDCLVRYPSPIKTGVEANDLVSMEWYMAKDDQWQPKRARAIVLVHESGKNMPVARLFARGIQLQGLHVFLVHLPGYGPRKVDGVSPTENMLVAMRQAMADVRRGRDAVSVLPCVESEVVGLAGISLGGFVASTVSGMDRGFQVAFILLAGGNLIDVINQGTREAADLRRRLEEAGIDQAKLKDLADRIEPLRLASRIDPAHTWLYAAKFDEVVPPKCSEALAAAAKLRDEHFVLWSANHYSGIVYLPSVLVEVHKQVTERKPDASK